MLSDYGKRFSFLGCLVAVFGTLVFAAIFLYLLSFIW